MITNGPFLTIPRFSSAPRPFSWLDNPWRVLLTFLKPIHSPILRGVRRLFIAHPTEAQNLNEERKKSLETPPLMLTEPSDAISRTDSHDWKYVAEGGSTVVFSYDGPRSPRFDGMVLRLRKSPRRSRSDVKAFDEEEDLNREDDPAVDFQEHVISRLVPTEFLPHLEHAEVEQAWLGKLIAAHDEERPEKRRVKDGIDLKRTRAVLATNLIGGKGWAVEIKVHL